MKLASRYLVFFLSWFQFEILYGADPSLKSVINASARHDPEKNVTHIDMDEKASRHLLKHWQDQAVSGLMAAVASQKIRTVMKADATAHEKCIKTANDVVKHAKCVSALLQKSVSRPTSETDENTKSLFARLRPEAIHVPVKPLEPFTPPTMTTTTPDSTATKSPIKKRNQSRFSTAKRIIYTPRVRYNRRLEKLKQKRRKPATAYMLRIRPTAFFEVIRKKRFSHRYAETYSLMPSQKQLTPIGMVAKYLMRDVLKAKNKTEQKPWQVMIEEVKQVNEERKRIKARQRQQDDNFENPYEALAFKGMDRRFNQMDIEDILSDREERKKYFNMVKEKNPSRKVLQLIRDGMKLGHSFFGKNVSNFDEKTIRVLSPRMLSVAPEETADNDDIVDFLSPSLFSLHDNGTGLEKQLSLPNLVKSFTSADQQQWLNLIFEASNVEEHLESARKALLGDEFQLKRKKRYQETMVDEHGNPLYFTKKKAANVLGNKEEMRIEQSEKLIKSYTPEQVKEMNQIGYTVLNKEQLELMYGSDASHPNQVMIDGWANKSKEEIHIQIEDEIHKLAVMKSFQQRQSDIVLAPIVNSVIANSPVPPILLSPILFTVVVGSPSVLGPIVLSPWVFLPLILSPRILSPVVLSPLAFVPIVLSPLTLHPVILCPGVLNVIVLSPLTLTPFILSPQVFCPIILSPMVMSPFIVNPSIGTPLVLSPFVLTPIIYSPLALMALVLSPNALSPIVKSELIAAEVILSPSWLS